MIKDTIGIGIINCILLTLLLRVQALQPVIMTIYLLFMALLTIWFVHAIKNKLYTGADYKHCWFCKEMLRIAHIILFVPAMLWVALKEFYGFCTKKEQ